MGKKMDQMKKKTIIYQAFQDFFTLVANEIRWFEGMDQAKERMSNYQAFLDFALLLQIKLDGLGKGSSLEKDKQFSSLIHFQTQTSYSFKF
jgi:hypothetical protein